MSKPAPSKIKIAPLTNDRARRSTFTKRKKGLMKKAMELSILCSCDVVLLVFGPQNQLYQYSSAPVDQLMYKAPNYDRPHKPYSNADADNQQYTIYNPSYEPPASPQPASDAASLPSTEMLRRVMGARGPDTALSMEAATSFEEFARRASTDQVMAEAPAPSESQRSRKRMRPNGTTPKASDAPSGALGPPKGAPTGAPAGLKISIPASSVQGAAALPIPIGDGVKADTITGVRSGAGTGTGTDQTGMPSSAGGLFPLLGSGMLRSPRDVYNLQFSPLVAPGSPIYNSMIGSSGLGTPGSSAFRMLSPRDGPFFPRFDGANALMSPRSVLYDPRSSTPSFLRAVFANPADSVTPSSSVQASDKDKQPEAT